MVIALLTRENISVFAFLCDRENILAQSKGLFLRNNCKTPRKKMKTCDFAEEIKNGNSAGLKGPL
jgi:hypothetical protein